MFCHQYLFVFTFLPCTIKCKLHDMKIRNQPSTHLITFKNNFQLNADRMNVTSIQKYRTCFYLFSTNWWRKIELIVTFCPERLLEFTSFDSISILTLTHFAIAGIWSKLLFGLVFSVIENRDLSKIRIAWWSNTFIVFSEEFCVASSSQWRPFNAKTFSFQEWNGREFNWRHNNDARIDIQSYREKIIMKSFWNETDWWTVQHSCNAAVDELTMQKRAENEQESTE